MPSFSVCSRKFVSFMNVVHQHVVPVCIHFLYVINILFTLYFVNISSLFEFCFFLFFGYRLLLVILVFFF